MLIVIVFLLLFLSLLIHIIYLTRYIQTRDQGSLYKFVYTAVTNVLMSGLLIYLALFMPEQIQKINFALAIWIFSGFTMFMMMYTQFMVLIRIYRRSKLPEHYHYNFFGKKVLHGSVVKLSEMGLFFASIPVLLVSGAYFIAKALRLLV